MSIPFSWHEKVKLPQWSVILDEYPIEDERQYLLRDEQKPVKWLGIITNGTGFQYTHIGYTKYKKRKLE